jgi:hypothetical protein
MIRDFQNLVPGGQLSAGDFNSAMAEIERLTRLLVRSPLTLNVTESGLLLGCDVNEGIWVRITGHLCGGSGSGSGGGSGSGSGSGGGFCGPFGAPSHYSGVEQTDAIFPEGCTDLPGGLQFFDDSLFLKEVSANGSVPENAIVRAYPSNNGPYYLFQFSSGGGSIVGGGSALVRTMNYTDGGSGTNYIYDPTTPNIIYWPSFIDGWAQPAGPYDSAYCFLSTPWQTNVVGGLAADISLLINNRYYTGTFMGYVALPLQDTGGELVGHEPPNNTTVAWPLFVTTHYPSGIKLVCTDVPPEESLEVGP